jgi:two-component system sensor histidine kinase ChvG
MNILKRIYKFLSKISIRLLIFNLLLVFLPIAASLYLKTYENQLLISLENNMVQQGRLLSAALSGDKELNKDNAKQILLKLNKRTTSRLRIIDKQGNLLADSSVINIPKKKNKNNRISNYKDKKLKATKKNGYFNLIYNTILYPIRIFRKLFLPPNPVSDPADFYSYNAPILGPEIKSALQGKYGAITRLSAGGQKSLTLYSAIPILNHNDVIGAVLVSQSTYNILKDLYEVRKDILKIFLITIIFAILISLLLDYTISRPIVILRNEAKNLLDKKGRLIGYFKESKRKDEIGDLARSLKELTRRLGSHLSFIESFSADLSHEMKNPIASIQNAVDISLTTKNRKEQKRFLKMIKKDAFRMEKLLHGIREITKIDISLDNEKKEKINPIIILQQIIEGYKIRNITQKINLEIKDQHNLIQIAPERFVQIIENLIDNAISFSPDNGVITIILTKKLNDVQIHIVDDGIGIEKENIDKVFQRFFSYRPDNNDKNKHTGLGLSIVKSLVEAYNGKILAKNKKNKGAEFIISLPIIKNKY